jgi:hypothetical protein
MKKEEIKEKLEIFYEWQKLAIGTYTETFTLADGIYVDITYQTVLVWGDYEFYVLEAVGHDENSRKLLKSLNLDYKFHESDAISNILSFYLSDLVAESREMYNELVNADAHDSVDLDEISNNYATFEDLWEDVEENFGEEKVEVNLNNEYDAVIEKGNVYVTVGCQSIHIDRIRAVVDEYYTLN